jgi:hypothetical protein
VSERLRRARGGVRGGAAAGGPPPRGGSGAAPPKKKNFWADIFSPVSSRHIIAGPTYFRDDIFPGPHDIRWFSAHGFCDGFLFPVKELGFWTNPGHWVRVLDAAGSYMYIVL